MKLAVNLLAREAVPLAEAAEELGYDLALAPEGYRNDAVSVLGLLAGRTSRIGLGSAVMQIPARPPASAALTAATLDALTAGRFRLGLGLSNPDVSEGWYGVPFDRPLMRTREYVEIVRAALRGGPVTYQGKHFRLPPSDRAAAPIHLYTEGHRADLPVYLGAVGPRNLQLAGEIADGWIGVFTSPDGIRDAVAEIAKGRAARGLGLDGFEVMPSLPTAVADRLEDAADELRGQYFYLMGIGDTETNFYCALARRLGFADDVERMTAHMAAGDRAAAQAAVPTEFIDMTGLIGPGARIAERMKEYAAAGVTTLSIMVSAAATTLEGRLRILETCAKAARSW
ncbi:LLM class flavin-dependent oxidoreductase [Streptomyces sp. MUM 203J]|uniref:LLM class flavin-dependent oxidoreductase n=1 Tax=Streptomyces sp. MUM 203J TaxID=2791990 RepID=UPI001F03B50E|nr:LLM class flavin-dependent oxidoreductase [Streptomyces sp. MUM 203J]MCH0540293.1 LLM class flavin-dependent oxidoreductase [Streptomyces sp. MUM 203J]